MRGIQYLTSQDGTRVAVQIDLKRHGQLWEDFCDTVTADARTDEPRYSLAEVKAGLRKAGKLPPTTAKRGLKQASPAGKVR